jgi:hypothetical protein
MSADFHKILVKDDVLNVTDDIGYAVLKGAQQITPTTFNASSISNQTHQFSVQIPSEQTLICREVLWRCTVQILVEGVVGAGQPACLEWGKADSFASFPLQRLLTNLQCQINNNTVSQNYQDVLPVIIRQMDTRRLSRYGGSTPTKPDLFSVAVGRETVGTQVIIPNLMNPANAYNLSTDPNYVGNGSFVLDSIVQTAGTATVPNSALITATFTEPILMSPWIWGQPESNNQGIYGIQNLNFTLQLKSSPSDALRLSSLTLSQLTASFPANAFSNSQLLFKFYTPHPSSLMPSRNVVPYSEYLLFRTPATAPAFGASSVVTSPSIQLNQVPSKLIIGVYNGWADSYVAKCDSYQTIDSITLQWNNGAGILSTATDYDLFKFSTESGSNQSWNEFVGLANACQNSLGFNAYTNQNASTTGSLVYLTMAKHVQLVEDFYSCSSIGNFNLTVKVNYTNNVQGGNYIPAVTPQLYVYVQNEGLFISEKGSSSTFTAVLNKNDVLDASMQGQPELTGMEAEGLAGSGMADKLLGAIGRRHQRMRGNVAGMGRSGGEMSIHSKGSSAGALSKYLK